MMRLVLALLCALIPSVAFGAALDQSKIIAPSAGVYFGAYEWTAGDIAAVESATGYTTSHYAASRGSWAIGYVSGHPHLDVTAANTAWSAGKAIVVQAYNLYAGTDDEHPSGFTVDKLLAGDYDSNLSTFAGELRSFGKPVWMQAGREPNGVGQDFMCGFGTDGMTAILDTYTQIKAVSLWSNHASWMVNDVFPYDCLFDNPLQVAALQAVVAARPGSIRSCVTLTDGILHPNCIKTVRGSGVVKSLGSVRFH